MRTDETGFGRHRWAFAAGFVPETGTGPEPDLTSRDELCVLNATGEDACAEVTILHADQDPVGPYLVEVPAQRVKHVRINDLIDPQAVPLGVPYGFTLESDVPVVVQVRHVDTRQQALAVAIAGAVADGG